MGSLQRKLTFWNSFGNFGVGGKLNLSEDIEKVADTSRGGSVRDSGKQKLKIDAIVIKRA